MMILLDTDVVSFLLRPTPPPDLVRRIHAVPMPMRYISAISVGELLFGLERSGRHEHIRAVLEAEMLSRTDVLPFDLPAARIFGRIKAHVTRVGTPVDDADLCIAAIALSHGLTLITGYEAHFRRVPDLRIENWLRP